MSIPTLSHEVTKILELLYKKFNNVATSSIGLALHNEIKSRPIVRPHQIITSNIQPIAPSSQQLTSDRNLPNADGTTCTISRAAGITYMEYYSNLQLKTVDKAAAIYNNNLFSDSTEYLNTKDAILQAKKVNEINYQYLIEYVDKKAKEMEKDNA